MAERLAIAYGARFGFDHFNASSAGTHAVTGSPIEPYAAKILEKLGGDPSHFSSRRLTPTIATDADLVLTMTRAHREDVLKLAPRQLHRTFTLSEAAQLVSECNARSVRELAAFRPQLGERAASDIPDPIGHNETYFETVGAQIADLLPQVVELCRRG